MGPGHRGLEQNHDGTRAQRFRTEPRRYQDTDGYNIYIITVDMKRTNYSDLIITKELLQGAGLRHYLINK